MSTTKEKIFSLSKSLVNDAELMQFSIDNFAKNFVVVIGVNQNRPLELDCPYIVIYSVDESEQGREKKTIIHLGIEVQEKNTRKLDENLDEVSLNEKIFVYDGFVEVEEFKEKIKESIKKNKVFMKYIFLNAGTIINTIFPSFSTTLSIEITNVISSKGS